MISATAAAFVAVQDGDGPRTAVAADDDVWASTPASRSGATATLQATVGC